MMKRTYLNLFKHDRKCPNCNLWASQTGGVKDFSTSSDGYEYMTCNQCDYTSKWINHGIACECIDTIDKGNKNVNTE